MLSIKTKDMLEETIERASQEGHTIWGFIVSTEGDELQTFTNVGDEVSVFIANTEEALKALVEVSASNNHA